MDMKKFILALAVIAGLTLITLVHLDNVRKAQEMEHKSNYYKPLCEYRGGSFTSPRHQQHHYRPHYHRYRRPLPVKTYFKYIPPPPRRYKIKRRRRPRGVC